MAVVRAAEIQTVEDIHALIRAAIANKHPIEAVYRGKTRLICPHRLGWSRDGKARVLSYQYGGQSNSQLAPVGSPENWRCMDLERLSRVKLVEDHWHSAPNQSRPQTCIAQVEIELED